MKDFTKHKVRLGHLVEEMAEAQQILGKILCFGWDNYHPDDPKKTPNHTLLEKELAFQEWGPRPCRLLEQAPCQRETRFLRSRYLFDFINKLLKVLASITVTVYYLKSY